MENQFTGNDFYASLVRDLRQNERVSDNGYTFVRWMDHWGHEGGLQFEINNNQRKTIPRTMIINAYDAYNHGETIDNRWVRQNGQDNWCFEAVLNHLISRYLN